MCNMRKCVLKFGEKCFHVVFVLGLIIGAVSAVISGITIGGGSGIISGITQLLLSWSVSIIVALIVYSLLEIVELRKQESCGKCPGCGCSPCVCKNGCTGKCKCCGNSPCTCSENCVCKSAK